MNAFQTVRWVGDCVAQKPMWRDCREKMVRLFWVQANNVARSMMLNNFGIDMILIFIFTSLFISTKDVNLSVFGGQLIQLVLGDQQNKN
jgi:hypothetical protein